MRIKFENYFNNAKDVDDIRRIYIYGHSNDDKRVLAFIKSSHVSTRSMYKVIVKNNDNVATPLLIGIPSQNFPCLIVFFFLDESV